MRNARSLAAIGALLGGILDIVYPPRCAGCEAGIKAAEQPLCGRCMASLERVDTDELNAALHRDDAMDVASFFALWMFDKGGILQRAQHLLKYGRRPAFGRALGRSLGDGWRAVNETVPDLVVPVPLHRARYYERGYNQSAMLASGVAESLRVPVLTEGIARKSATRRQTGLTKQQRTANVDDAFSIRSKRIEGRAILLIDDVVTTGSTCMAAAHAIRAAGAARVDFAALAFARY